MASGRDRRKSERYETASIPVQLSDVNAQLIDLSLTGAAVIHRSPVKAGGSATLIFPSHGGFYIPCQVLRSVVSVRREHGTPEYVYRSAIHFLPIPAEQEPSLHEFINIQIEKLEEKRRAAEAEEDDEEAPSY
jgi:hypothetical protein